MIQEKIEQLESSIKSDMALLSDLKREEKSNNFSNKIFLQRPGVYTVNSLTSKKQYTVNLSDNTCTCPDNTHRGVACIHLRAVKKLTKEEGLWV